VSDIKQQGDNPRSPAGLERVWLKYRTDDGRYWAKLTVSDLEAIVWESRNATDVLVARECLRAIVAKAKLAS
jgi:hypothetical protein